MKHPQTGSLLPLEPGSRHSLDPWARDFPRLGLSVPTWIHMPSVLSVGLSVYAEILVAERSPIRSRERITALCDMSQVLWHTV